MRAQLRRSTSTAMKCSDAPSQWLLIVVACKCPQFLYCRDFFLSLSQHYTLCKLQSNVAFLFEHLEKQHLLLAVATVVLLQPRLYCCLLSGERGFGGDVTVCLFFTSHVIAFIKKSSSSDRRRVCVGWLEGLDWMYNKQDLPPKLHTAQAIKRSLWWRPSRV